jgi:hypothetical protein
MGQTSIVGRFTSTEDITKLFKEDNKMTVSQMMTIGCNGMNASQKDAEQSRRLHVVERLNKLGSILPTVTDKPKRNRILREMKSIKSDESLWLKECAWFLY